MEVGFVIIAHGTLERIGGPGDSIKLPDSVPSNIRADTAVAGYIRGVLQE